MIHSPISLLQSIQLSGNSTWVFCQLEALGQCFVCEQREHSLAELLLEI